MATVNIYLTFNGNCEEVFLFYKSIFGGEFSNVSKIKDMPAQEGMPSFQESDMDKIMHISLPISKETILMGADYLKSYGYEFVAGNNFSISVLVESKSEADRIFNALSDGGAIDMPMEDTFWGAYFGMLVDKFGINWMINVDLK